MTEPTEEQLARLPKWARDHIAYLEKQLNDRYAEITRRSGKYPGSNVVVSPYADFPEQTLPPDSRLTFFMEPARADRRDGIEVQHANYVAGPQLVVRTTLGTRLEILPSAANSVFLRSAR